MDAAVRTNQYEGPCVVCGETVRAGEGILLPGKHGGWEVCHPEHAREPAPPPRGRHTGWHRRRLMAVDIAATGRRTGVDRILAAAVRTTDGRDRDWLIDPGPGLAVDSRTTHGIPLDQARAHGVPASRALDELATHLAGQLVAKELLVVWHAPYVLTLLESELLRHGLRPLSDRGPGGLFPVCDPLILDRHADRYRSGGRALEKVAEWYGVPHDRPGNPGSDAAASLVLAQVIGACHASVGRLSRPALHYEQVRWREQQASEAEEFDPSRKRDHRWPLGTVEALPWEAPAP
ncbi:3'-5' exonuclease [Streptomyces sp. NBC_00879]|uniref:3'-5' exonuclease n=1 Tax=Streptomyces sp. NBC_00879 TaxID=2975855 RepID=UPI003867B285|nr:3'-5' exonuclease [Streptomyces sp. NBC_00879]